jgi:beta-lactamase superfamily II metal-dependent hydrolase
MDSQLLVRLYNVGLGDCIYLRVPDLHRKVHILIDCGNKFGSLARLGECIALLKKDLPKGSPGKKRLDLLVVSHPHEDHHKGFEEEFFADIEIEAIWLSPAFDRLNPKAQGFHALKAAAQRALRGLSAVAAGEMKAQVEELLSLSKEEAIDLLCKGLNKGIKPLYVTADTPPAELKIFKDPKIKLKAIGPMGDVDNYYLGGAGLVNALMGVAPQGMAEGYRALFPGAELKEVRPPRNISAQDFKLLRNHIQANALAAAELAGKAENNLSVVLLLEWHGRRLLFPGDAEWSGKNDIKVKPGKCNSSWNVMWEKRNADLAQPLDFLKIGHHGSENATPWAPADKKGKFPDINQILDALLPLPQPGETPRAYAVASTERTTRWPSIPNAELIETIGRRVVNSRTAYVEAPGDLVVKPGVPQPQRTDLENQVTGTPLKYIDVTFQAVL